MSGGHAIETLSFEVEFATEGQARAQHMRFGDFAAGRGLAVIEEVFDEFAAAGETVRLDQLEVDLGETPASWSEAEAEQRLREALRRALRDAIGPRPRVGAAGRDLAAAGADELETVWGHLHDGLLPWNLATTDRETFEDLVRRVMARHGATLAARLRSAPAQARLIARLARQWPRGALEVLAQELGAAAEAVAALPPPAAAPEAWERSLGAELGIGSDRDETRKLAPALTVEEAAWPRLINGEPTEVRARLRGLAHRSEDRVRLAALLTDARQRQVLSLWAADPDVDFLQALLTTPRAWRLGAPMGDAIISRVLREGLLEHLLALPGQTLDAAAVVEALIIARARADGLAHGKVVNALVAGWPAAGHDAAMVARLRAALAARGLDAGLDAGPALDTPPADPAPIGGWRFDVAPAEHDDETRDAAQADKGPWTRRLRLEPAGVADQLRRMGRTEAGRRRLARDLTPARLADVLTLWVEPADAAFVAAVVTSAEPWRLGGPHAVATLAVLLRQWLLDELLLAPPGPPRAGAALILALVRRRAAYDDLPVAWVTQALAHAWPAGSAPLVRLRDVLSEAAGALAAAPTAMATGSLTDAAGIPARQAPPDHPTGPSGIPAEGPPEAAHAIPARIALEAAFDAVDIPAAITPLRELLVADRPWLAEQLRRRAGERRFVAALASGLPASLLFELAQPRLSEPALRLLLVAAPTAETGADVVGALWAEVLTALWAPAGPEPDSASGGDALLTVGALARRLWRSAGREPRRELARVLRRAGGYVRDEITAALLSTSPAAAAPVNLADWRGRLPDRPNAAAARAISALLVPVAAGMQALVGFTEAERRDLMLRLRPADAPGALGAAGMLAAAARAAALTEPPDGWDAFGWRAVLRDLFEEARPFEPTGFAARWFEAWSASVPAPAATPARARLALALETLPLARLLRRDLDEGATDAPDDPTQTTLAASGPPPAQPAEAADLLAARPTEEAPEADTGTTDAGTSSSGEPARAFARPPADHPREIGATPPAQIEAPASTPIDATTGAPIEPQAGRAPSPAPEADSASAQGGDYPADLPDPAALAAALRPASEPTGSDALGDAVEPDADGTIYIDNAGLVLAGPFIPMLLNRLELTRSGKFVDERGRERAVHLLQFLLDGEEEPAPEHRLALNKLVCGIDFSIPIGRDFRIEDAERALVESLLRTMIERWTTLGSTSIGGLRETFLMRRGALRPHEEAWKLTVEPGPFDMLLDRIPWGYGLLKLPWMAQVLHVDWR